MADTTNYLANIGPLVKEIFMKYARGQAPADPSERAKALQPVSDVCNSVYFQLELFIQRLKAENPAVDFDEMPTQDTASDKSS